MYLSEIIINVPVGYVCWFSILILEVFLYLLVLYSVRGFFPATLVLSSRQRYLVLLNSSNLCESALFVAGL